MEEKKISKECLAMMKWYIDKIAEESIKGNSSMARVYACNYNGYVDCLRDMYIVDYQTSCTLKEDANNFYSSFYKFQKQESGVTV